MWGGRKENTICAFYSDGTEEDFSLIAKLSFPDICKLCAAYKYIFKLENVTASTDLHLLSHFTSLVKKSPFKKLKLS